MRTKVQTRKYIAEIVGIVDEINELNLRKRAVAKKLGFGTWRSHELPGVMVVCGQGTAGWCVQWRPVAEELAEQLKLSHSQLMGLTHGNRKRTFATPTVSVRKDKTHRANPKLKVY